jgi:ABC-type phosphate/phosphonate transport system substrate-binding protein
MSRLTALTHAWNVPAMPIISLPMYDWPELRGATDAWGHGIARHLRQHGFADAPLELLRRDDYGLAWLSSDLLLSQTCGYPLTHAFAQSLLPVLTPHYAVEGCSGPGYSSFILVRRSAEIYALDDLRSHVCAINGRHSLSGMLALKIVFAPLAREGRFFARTLETGSHLGSLQAVGSGQADVCAIDAVCLAMAKRYRPELVEGLIELARSPLLPGLPMVTSRHRSADDLGRLRRALQAAFADPELHDVRQALFIAGASALDVEDYAVILKLERDLERRGDLALWQAA